MKKFKLSLFIFRRDLRLEDNTALQQAMNLSEKVIPCFIFDDRQIKKNPFFGENAFLFLLQSLSELAEAIASHHGHLYFFDDIAEVCVEKLLNTLPIDAVFLNRDYTVFSQQRDLMIKQHCDRFNCEFISCADSLLSEPEAITKNDGLPYTIFTPFYRRAKLLMVKKPIKFSGSSFYTSSISFENRTIVNHYLNRFSKKVLYTGGRKTALKNLSTIQSIKDYAKYRDFPAKNATSHLSAHHKFGTISIRESYHAVHDAIFQKELYWRDFFTHIAFHFPKIFSGAFYSQYDNIRWENNETYFEKWCMGQTGFPLVDAGMRELNQTGYMHNRVRMVVASFLVKDLHIDWHRGEQYFAQKLIDYDPAVNNGNWQWAASTGCDAQPYFRIFNPILQQKRFDPACEYIKTWIPDFDPKTYLQPMVDHAKSALKAKSLYKNIKYS